MESGTTVEYRCPSCRDCNKCRDSEYTDKISIREEIEQKQVEDSISFDRISKKIWVSLPKRGDESFFLTSNRDMALKVYQKMCEKASKDPAVKTEIIAAVEKLFRTGQAIYLEDVDSERLEKFIHKPIQHYLPWRVVFKPDSLTTSVRPVFDASANTKRRPDGTGGRSLNDLLCKGRIKSMNLLRMLIRFSIGKYAMSGDLQQFYCSCKLQPDEMNLTRFLYKSDLDLKSDPEECVFQALGFGLKSASAQSETVKEILACQIREKEPELALLLEDSTYVDDMGDSKTKLEDCTALINTADREFSEIGLKCKQWTLSGQKPSEIVSEDGLSILVGGSEWFPQVDAVSVRIPPLHFGKVRRGRLDKNTQIFRASGDFKADLSRLEDFCPKLTRRICASKAAAPFDIRGLRAPVLAGTKNLMRETVRCTEDWDEEISSTLRQKWLLEFLRLESLRGIAFDRPIMPVDAVSSVIRLITLSDASKTNIMLGVWGGFELPDGSYSCKLIIGRSILAKDATIPKLELDGICSGANLGWIVRTALKGWECNYLQASDSTIALCWLTSEQLRLNEFHRNRVVQIRRGIELSNIYHVKTDLLAADVGTRPDRVRVEDIMTGSRWHNGEQWMKTTVAKAIAHGSIKPALDLRVHDEDKEEFKDGVVYDKIPEVLTRGHALNKDRISKVEARAIFSQYIVIPTKYNFKKSFRVTMLVIKFAAKCLNRLGKRFQGSKLSLPLEKVPKIFTSICSPSLSPCQQNSDFPKNSDCFHGNTDLFRENSDHFKENSDLSCRNTDLSRNVGPAVPCDLLELDMMQENESYVKLAATYFFRTASLEVIQFNKKDYIDKISVEQNSILYSKNRLLEGMEFSKVSGMDMINLDPLGVNTKCPVIDRHSPLAYSIGQYIHHNLSGHSGMETCNRLALERFFIIQGPSLFRELAQECIKCKIKRKRFLEMSMGPIGSHALTIAPPFYATQADLFGPITVYAPGAARDLRGRPAKACKVWTLVFACPVTRLVNCQVVELSDHTGILDGLTRLAAEVGFPKYLMIDQDSAIMKGLKEATVNLRNLQHQIYNEKGVIFTTCPVGGHNVHGHVERVIRSVQELLEQGGVKLHRYHATGYQTLLKLVENNYNSLPIGYSFDRSSSNTPMLKIITPNFFKFGRNNDRALDGPVNLPQNGGELLERVNETYQGLFKLWSDVFVPKLIYQPKWHRDDKDLNIGDLVYFQKDADNPLGSTWIIGIIDQVVRSRDGRVRRVIIKYQNHNEDIPRFTDRTIRKLVKIYDVDEYVLQDDLFDVLKRTEVYRDDENTTANDPDTTFDQVMSSYVCRNNTLVDPSCISGTWPLQAVPGQSAQVPDSGEDIAPNVPNTFGDCGRVPSEEDLHVYSRSTPSTHGYARRNPSICVNSRRIPSPCVHSRSYPSTCIISRRNPSTCYYSRSNPHFNPVLVNYSLGLNLHKVDDVITTSLVEDFILALDVGYITFDASSTMDNGKDLMELIASSNLILE